MEKDNKKISKNNKKKVSNKISKKNKNLTKKIFLVVFTILLLLIIGILIFSNMTSKYDRILRKLDLGMSMEEVDKIIGVKGVQTDYTLDKDWAGIYVNYEMNKNTNTNITCIFEDKKNKKDLSSIDVNELDLKSYANKKVSKEKINKAVELINKSELEKDKVITLKEIEKIMGVIPQMCGKYIEYSDDSIITSYIFVTPSEDYIKIDTKNTLKDGIVYAIYKIDNAHNSIIAKCYGTGCKVE